MNDSSGKDNSFTAPFGTNHAFNRFMDYFFVGNHQSSVGHIDGYGKLSYSNGRLDLSAVPHLFYADGEVHDSFGESDAFLGTEVDIIGSYRFHKDMSLNLGYSQMFATNSLEISKGGNSEKVQNWAWIMVSFHPVLFSSRTAPQFP